MERKVQRSRLTAAFHVYRITWKYDKSLSEFQREVFFFIKNSLRSLTGKVEWNKLIPNSDRERITV